MEHFHPVPAPTAPSPTTPGPDWCRPGDLAWPDLILRRAYCDSYRPFLRAAPGGFCLAYAFSPRRPFPLPPIFCLARLLCLSGRLWWVFSFDDQLNPRFEGV